MHKKYSSLLDKNCYRWLIVNQSVDFMKAKSDFFQLQYINMLWKRNFVARGIHIDEFQRKRNTLNIKNNYCTAARVDKKGRVSNKLLFLEHKYGPIFESREKIRLQEGKDLITEGQICQLRDVNIDILWPLTGRYQTKL